MSSSMEAEMARFEEEISSANEKSGEDFKPPPPPPLMPPMFLPHALQSGNKQNQTDKNDQALDGDISNDLAISQAESKDSDNRAATSTSNSVQSESSDLKTQETNMSSNIGMPMGPGSFGPGSGNSLPRPLGPPMGPGSVPINSMGPGPLGPMLGPSPIRPGPGPMGPGPMGPGPMGPMPSGPMLPRPMGPGPIGPMAGPMGPGNMLGPMRPPGPLGPNMDGNMMNPLPPPMPSFFPPPVLPDFSNVGQSKQTVYAAAPVLNKKTEKEKRETKSTPEKKKKVEKPKAKTSDKKTKEEKEVVKSTPLTKDDDRLSVIGPEAGPRVGPNSTPQVPPMQLHAYATQPPLYGLSPLAGNPEMVKAAAQVVKKKKIIRTAAGQKWDDPSLLEWDPNDYRIFCGDLGNEVTDDTLARVFSRYSSFQKARVVRDKNSKKSRGYGFVSFKDPTDFIRAMREINGKYVGNRPIKLRKSNWKDRNIDVVRKKTKEKKKLGYKV